MSADDTRIRTAVAAIIGKDSRFFPAVCDRLSDERRAAREAAAILTDKKWLSSLSPAQVVAALATIARRKKETLANVPAQPEGQHNEGTAP